MTGTGLVISLWIVDYNNALVMAPTFFDEFLIVVDLGIEKGGKLVELFYCLFPNYR
jgi:hypothetical protein